MNDNTVLVTGGSGYIGRHLCALLKNLDIHVVIFDRVRLFDTRTDFVGGDVRNLNDVSRAFCLRRVDSVIHLAALVGARAGLYSENDHEETNVRGGLNVLSAMRRFGCRNFVYSSSAAVYGHTSGSIHESQKTIPVSAYGKSKLLFEKEVIRRAQNGSISATILRLFNVAGNSSGRETLMHNALRVIQNKQPTLDLYGDDLPTPDGTGVRDYVHVLDVVNALHKSLIFTKKKQRHDIINIGSGKPTSNKEIIHVMEQISGFHIPVHIAKARDDEIIYSVADRTKAEKKLSWSPGISSVQEIVSSMFRYYGIL